MPEESNTITIARPVGDVFAFLADAENDKLWRPGVVEIARTGGQGVGTTYHQVVSGPGDDGSMPISRSPSSCPTSGSPFGPPRARSVLLAATTSAQVRVAPRSHSASPRNLAG